MIYSQVYNIIQIDNTAGYIVRHSKYTCHLLVLPFLES